MTDAFSNVFAPCKVVPLVWFSASPCQSPSWNTSWSRGKVAHCTADSLFVTDREADAQPELSAHYKPISSIQECMDELAVSVGRQTCSVELCLQVFHVSAT